MMQTYNPSTLEPLSPIKKSSTQDIEKQVLLSIAAQKEWRKTSLDKKKECLEKFRALLEENTEKLGETISQETGKIRSESLSEVRLVINKIAVSLNAHAEKSNPLEHRLEDRVLKTTFKPYGVAAVLGPFNFPAHLPFGHIIPLLIEGNSVILKPSPQGSHTAALFKELMEKAGFNEGVFSVIYGENEEAEQLLRHPAIRLICATGGEGLGLFIRRLLAEYPQKVAALELGGNNPLCVSSFSTTEKLVEDIIKAAFLTTGQRCTNARRLILLDNPLHRVLLEKVIEKASNLKIGAYNEKPEPFMGPLATHGAFLKHFEHQKILEKMGAQPLLLSQKIERPGYFVTPGVFSLPEKSTFDEEFFSPLLVVKWVKDFPHMVEEANKTRFGLAASLYSENAEEWEIFLDTIDAGVVNWNFPPNQASSLAPFGGVKASGNAHPSGFAAVEYSHYPCVSYEKL